MLHLTNEIKTYQITIKQLNLSAESAFDKDILLEKS